MTFELPAWIDRGHLPLLGAGAASVVALLLLLAFLVARRRRAAAAGVTADREGGAAGAPSGEAEADGPRTAAQRFRAGLARSRTRLAARLAAALGSGGPDLDDELLRVLVESDVGPRSAQEILAGLGRLPADRRDVASVRSELRERIEAMVRGPEEASEYPTRPWVILVVGVNGVGKTTSIGKLAARHGALGRSVLLVAGDTFRAAAADQLEVWAGRTGAGLVRQAEGADPSSVVFDGMKAAVARDVDVVLVDTAGRLHTKTNLMEELRKVRRTIDRVLPGAPHEVLLVLDATTGQNAVSQARTFAEAVDVTGVVLTKLDGSARGGVVVAIRRELGLPVRWVGLGERAEDLEPFDAGEFARALVGDGEEG
jgi:fused signal recognition particle receptor